MIRTSIPAASSHLSKDSGVLLTIGIPTFNRPHELIEILTSIESGISSRHNLSLEVLISDNNSFPSVESIVKPFLMRNLEFRLLKNIENIGYDRNIDQIFRAGRGRFILIVSDDDRVKPERFLELISSIEENGADIYLYESEFYDSNLEIAYDIEEDFFKFVELTKLYPKGKELLAELPDEIFGGITGFCMKKSIWTESNTHNYMGTNWIHLGVLLENLETSSLCVVREKFFDYRMDNKNDRWSIFKVNFGIFQIYQNSGMLHYYCCRQACEKYKKVLLYGSISKKYKLLDRIKLLLFAISKNRLSIRVFTLKDFAILLFSLTPFSNFIHRVYSFTKKVI